MSPLSVPVLAAAALLSSPALWRTFVEGTAPTMVGLSRFLVAMVACWAALAALAALVGPPPHDPADSAGESDPDSRDALVGEEYADQTRDHAAVHG